MDKYKKYGLYDKYKDASLQNLHKETPTDIRKILVKHKNISKTKFYREQLNFFIASAQRIGKTWALHAIANCIIDRFDEKSVRYVTAGALQKGFVSFSDLKGVDNLISTLAGKRFLFIDDLGLEYRKEQSVFVKVKFEEFLRWRMSNNKVTYLASKIYGEDFIDFYGQSLYDFICGEYVDINIEEPDFNIGKIILEENLQK